MSRNPKCISLLLLSLLLCSLANAQAPTGVLKGQVTDSSGSSIPGADVTVSNGKGYTKALSTDGTGTFTAPPLPPGNYTVRVVTTGFDTFQSKPIAITAGKTQTLSIPLQLAASKQEVTVSADAVGTVSVDPSQNAGQLVLKGTDLEALPDDPDDLAADLQALAGPAAGPNGGQIYIDGFTGGRLPPKESIREIRVNSNPFSAEYDRLGFGRIEILTKPGSDKYRGQVSFNDSEARFNSRNPYLTSSAPPASAISSTSPGANSGSTLSPDFHSRQYEGSFGGPLGKKTSFFTDFERRDIADNAIVNATLLDTSFNPYLFSQAVATPNTLWRLNQRADYQLSTNNTLVARYSYDSSNQTGAGIGNFSLASQGYNTTNNGHRVQLTETSVIAGKIVNETRFQFLNDRITQTGNNSLPTVNVLQAFNGGGSQVGNYSDTQRHYELQNYTSFSKGTHSLKFGARVRSVTDDNFSPNNFGGAFQFASGLAPVLDPTTNQPVVPGIDCSGLANQSNPGCTSILSIERYRRTLVFQQQGLSPAQIRKLGGGASQFSIAGGNPFAALSQTDIGIFALDDWRLRPNFTLSLGLRYETQNNISDHADFAPRLGFAWSPGSSKGGRSKTVIRGGSGLFYDRFSEGLVLNSLRFNGTNQLSYTVTNPDFYPNVPAISAIPGLAGAASPPATIRTIDRNLNAQYIVQSAIGVERQLPFNTTLAVNWTNSHGIHLLRTRNINAPFDGTFVLGDPAKPGIRPYGDAVGNIYQYESDGILNQNQLIFNVNSRLNSNLSIFTYYVLNHAKSNTDGAATFPADTYNLSTEYGRSSLDIRHRFVFGGNVATKFGIRLSPFIIANSGRPFNITTGQDLNGDLQYVDRPSFAPASACGQPNVKCTAFGDFNLNPAAGAALIPRNYGQGPSFFSVNLRVSKTWGFGERTTAARGVDGGGGGGGRGGPGGGGMRGGGMGGPGGGMRGMGGFDGGGSTNKRYNLNLSLNARNLLNTVNQGDFSGNLTSPLFGRSNQLANGFGPPGGASNNRRISVQLRFSF